jgi:hypothetical protein
MLNRKLGFIDMAVITIGFYAVLVSLYSAFYMVVAVKPVGP